MLRATRGSAPCKARVGWQHGRQVQRSGARVRVQAAMDTSMEDYTMSADEIKAALLDSFWGTERGLTASSETRAEINELITQLEATSPNLNTTEAMDKLAGTWKLLYTSNSELMALLAFGKLPFVSVDDIIQTVTSIDATIVNTFNFTVPGSKNSVSTTASVQVQSPKRLNLKFEKGTISTPELLTDIDIPSSTTVMGQSVDLSALKSALEPVQSASRSFITQIGNLLSQQPDLNIPIRSRQAQTWLLTTYLDDSLRISRGDAGSVFVLAKEAPTETAPSVSASVVPLPEDIDVQENPGVVGEEVAAMQAISEPGATPPSTSAADASAAADVQADVADVTATPAKPIEPAASAEAKFDIDATKPPEKP